jgi:hypothetical protein
LLELQERVKSNAEEVTTNFFKFEVTAQEILTAVGAVFTKTIDTDIVDLQQNLIKYSALSFTLGQTIADAKAHQQLFEVMHYCPKSDKYSEADRKLLMRTLVTTQSSLVQKLVSAEEKLDKRITIIQSVLKSENIRLMKMGEDDDQSSGVA